jgi:hypothetical protein
MGLRDRQLFGYRRDVWVASLTKPSASFFVLVGPHPFTPTDLLSPAADGSLPGLTPVTELAAGNDRADILSIDAQGVRAGTPAVPLHLSTDAALAWLDMAGGGPDATARLLAVRPVITGDDLERLLARLGGGMCELDWATGTRLGPADECP